VQCLIASRAPTHVRLELIKKKIGSSKSRVSILRRSHLYVSRIFNRERQWKTEAARHQTKLCAALLALQIFLMPSLMFLITKNRAGAARREKRCCHRVAEAASALPFHCDFDGSQRSSYRWEQDAC